MLFISLGHAVSTRRPSAHDITFHWGASWSCVIFLGGIFFFTDRLWSWRHFFIYLWGFITPTCKTSAVTLNYHFYTFISNGPSFKPCITAVSKTPPTSSVMPLSSFGDKDEPLGNFQLITTHFSGHRWSYSKRNCIGSIIQARPCILDVRH